MLWKLAGFQLRICGLQYQQYWHYSVATKTSSSQLVIRYSLTIIHQLLVIKTIYHTVIAAHNSNAQDPVVPPILFVMAMELSAIEGAPKKVPPHIWLVIQQRSRRDSCIVKHLVLNQSSVLQCIKSTPRLHLFQK